MSEQTNTVNRETIREQIDMWVATYLEPEFEFRPHQRETIEDMLYNVLSHGEKYYAVEAPTGIGKSLINIIAGGILGEYYDIQTYVLVSDLFLWAQYDNFLKKYPDMPIAILKGQTGNYQCQINGEDIKNSDCRMAGLSWSSMWNRTLCEERGYTCAYTCEYVLARHKAIRVKTCVMTYQLFLFILNNPKFNMDSHGRPIFKPSEVVLCDECHNIPSIVKLQYSPSIVPDDFLKIEKLYLYGQKAQQLTLFDEEETDKDKYKFEEKTLSELSDKLNDCWAVWVNPKSRKDEDYEKMVIYLNVLKQFHTVSEEIKQDIARRKLLHQPISKDDMTMFKIASWHENNMCHWGDFVNAISITGYDYLLKEVSNTKDPKMSANERITTSFVCTKEDYITYRFLLTKSNYFCMLSATIGSKDSFNENMGFKYERWYQDTIEQLDKETDSLEITEKQFNEYIKQHRIDDIKMTGDEYVLKRVPPVFDFTKSPIYFLNKFKMSYKQKDVSLKRVCPLIYTLCLNKFKDRRGIIQTGSYQFAKHVYDNAPKEVKDRMLVYHGSREKDMMVQIHKMSSDTILVGPTLDEGIDLPGDECRFIFIIKTPYPSLQDKSIKEKCRLFPLWYNSFTASRMIQGIGRGVRYDGDYCDTYIFDACFYSLYVTTLEQWPQELRDRIQII